MGVCCVSAEVLYLCALAASDEKGVGAVAGRSALVATLPASVGVPGDALRATGLRTDAAAVGAILAPRVGAQADRERRAAQGGGDALVRHDARARRKRRRRGERATTSAVGDVRTVVRKLGAAVSRDI